LHRSSVDKFDEADAFSMEQLERLRAEGMPQLDAMLLPVGAALEQFPEIILNGADSLDIREGRRIGLEATAQPGLRRLRSSAGVFLGLGEIAASGELSAKRLMNTAR
jgi:tRNA U55 pseudouridine synthase TruB